MSGRGGKGGRGRRKPNYKGRTRRNVGSADEIAQRNANDAQEREARLARRGPDSDEEAAGAGAGAGAAGAGSGDWRGRRNYGMPPSDSESEEEYEPKAHKPKGVQGLIEVENPNYRKPQRVKAKDVDTNAKVQLSRREREELARQAAERRYAKLHAQGKTEQARTDMARLAEVRARREAATKRREQEELARKQAAEAERTRRR